MMRKEVVTRSGMTARGRATTNKTSTLVDRNEGFEKNKWANTPKRSDPERID
jgi:hypothetical protein